MCGDLGIQIIHVFNDLGFPFELELRRGVVFMANPGFSTFLDLEMGNMH